MTGTSEEFDISSYRFKAFISYNHQDKDFAKWLHKSLESYKIPKNLARADGSGPVPERLFPVFRDREDMSAGADLSSEIKGILADSAYLIVICSPNSAKSRWVNEEIKHFRRLGRGDRILTIIAGGTPGGSAIPGQEDQECFPPALRLDRDEAGQDLGPALEPIAADARAEADGRANAKLKIISALLDTPFNTLRRREVEAQRRRIMGQALIGTGVVVAILAITITFLLYQNWYARADLFSAQAQAALAQKDYARAEIAAAESINFHDLPATRELLLQAQMGGVRFVARSPQLAKAEATAISADGQLVATVEPASADKPIRIQVSSMRENRVLWSVAMPMSAEMPNSIALDAPRQGARQIAIAWPEQKGAVSRVGVWALRPGADPGTFRELTTGQGMIGRHNKRIPSMAFNPAHNWIATGGEDGKLTLWDLDAAQPKLIWEQDKTHSPDVHGISFNPDGTLLGSAGGDYAGRIWSVADMAGPNYTASTTYQPHKIKEVAVLNGHADSVFAIAFSPDGKHVATGGYDRAIFIWEFDGLRVPVAARKDPRRTATLTGNEGTIFALSYSDDGKLLMSGASDGGADLWDAEASRLLNRFTPGQDIIRAVAAPSFESGVYIAGQQGWSVFSVSGSPVLKRLWNGGATVNVATYDPTGDYLAVSGGGDNGRIRVWDRSYHLLHILDPKLPGEAINGMTFSPDGHWLAAGGATAIHVWNRGTPSWDAVPVPTNFAHDDLVWGLCFDAKSTVLFTSSQGDTARIKRWNVGSWTLDRETPQLANSVYALVCDDASGRIAAGDSRARVTLLNMSDLRPVERITNVHEGELNVWSLSLANDVHAIVSGNSDGHVYSWVPHDPAWAAKNKGMRKRTSDADAIVNPTINSVAYNASRHWIAAGGVGPSVEIYDANTMAHLRSLRGHDGTIWWVTFDRAGTRLAYGGLDKLVRVVDLNAMDKIFSESPSVLRNAAATNSGLTIRGSQISPY